MLLDFGFSSGEIMRTFIPQKSMVQIMSMGFITSLCFRSESDVPAILEDCVEF